MFGNFSVGLLILGVVFVGVFVGYDLYKNSKISSSLRKYTFEQKARRWVLFGGLVLLALMSIVSHLWVQILIGVGSLIVFVWFWFHCCSKFMEYLDTPKDARAQRYANVSLVYDAKTMAVYAVLLVLLGILVCLACLIYAWSLESVGVLGGVLSLGGIYYIWSKRGGSLQPQGEDYAAAGAIVLIIMGYAVIDFSLINDQPPLHVAMEQERLRVETITPPQEQSPPPEPTPSPEAPPEEQDEPNPTLTVEQVPQTKSTVGFVDTDGNLRGESSESYAQTPLSTGDLVYLEDVSGANKHQEALQNFFFYETLPGEKPQFILEIDGKVSRGDVEITIQVSGGGSTLRPKGEGTHVYYQNGEISFFQVKYTGKRKVSLTLSVPKE